MNKVDLEHVRKLVKRDEKYKRFRAAVEKNPNLKLAFDDLHDELNSMHKMRLTRSLNRKSKRFTKDVIDAMTHDTSCRSRCAEILMSCLAITGDFQDTLNNLRDYLMLEYGGRITTGRSSKEERRQFMENVLRPFFRYIHKVEQLKKHAEYLVEDIDKASYRFRDVIEAIKLLGKPESL
jgi:hypothetical protein